MSKTPEGFPLPGEIAEDICRTDLKPHNLHRRIAEAIAERDRLWRERFEEKESKESSSTDGEESNGLYRPLPPGMYGKPIC